MDATTAVPLVTPDAHWSPASALLEVPCLPSHPNARGPCQARAVRNPGALALPGLPAASL